MTHPTAADCLAWCWSAAAPRRALSVSEWADQHRVLSGKQAGEPGRWRTARNPILREIMDCFSAASRVRDVVVKKSSQVGVTEATVNVLGYTIDHAPGPTMVLMPSLESRDAWKVQKLNPLLTDTPAVRDILGGNRARDAANRQDMIDFPGGVIFLGGGNSPNSYAQRSARTIILDDLDRFPEEIGDEGDPIVLANGRTKAFARGRRAYISTPTVQGAHIDRLWEQSDQRRYHVPCPHCGHLQPLDWGGPDVAHGMKWTILPTGEVTHVRYVCADCGAEILEHHKPALLAAGRWIAAHPQRPMRGYHISALYAPIGLGPSWLELVRGWIDAQGNTATLRAWINTNLGEAWRAQGEESDPTALLARLEAFPDDMPRRPRTCGIDVQKDRLEAVVCEWGPGEECWITDHLIVDGDTAGPEPWAELAEELETIAPDAAGLDTGYNTDQAMAFAARRPWVWACKGIEGIGKTLTEDDETRKRRLRKRRKKGHSPHLVGDTAAKALLMQRLKLEAPGPGYLHLPREPWCDDEWLAQLTSNRLEEERHRGRLVVRWVQTRVRNEAYDCWKYALAALRLSKIDPARFIARAAEVAQALEAGPLQPRRPALPRVSIGGRRR